MKTITAWLLVAVACAACVRPAWADGDTVLASSEVSEWRMTILISPEVPGTEPADFSVLVENLKTGLPVDDLEVTLTFVPDFQTSPELTVEATRAAATDKRYYSAQCELPTSGDWRVTAQAVQRDDTEMSSASTAHTFKVDRSPSRWPVIWMCVAVPAVVILLYVLSRQLKVKP